MTATERKLILNAFDDANLTIEERELFLALWKPISFEKGDFLTLAGDIEQRFYVVVEGVQSVYLHDEKGREVVIAFSFDGSYSGIYDSLIDRQPSNYYLRALTDSKLYFITHQEYASLFERYSGFDRWGRITHGELLRGRVKREVELITETTEQRFLNFMQRCPKPLHAIPRKHLASYLNMTQETFSRLFNSVKW